MAKLWIRRCDARRWLLAVTVVAGSRAGHAQASSALTVLTVSPKDTATPGVSVTVQFDRPVVTTFDGQADPRKIFQISPAVPGSVMWRDPVTLRFVPAAPLVPGTRYIVTIRNTFTAMGGARLGRPYDLFRSHLRPIARLLNATLRIRPGDPRLGALTETLVLQQRAERGMNTQDYTSFVAALAQMAERQHAASGRQVTVSVAGNVLYHLTTNDTAAADSGVSLATLLRATPHGDRVLPIDLRAAGSGAPVYYSITVTEIPKHQPVTPDASGMLVEHWYEGSDGKPLAGRLKAGELVRVWLRVTVPNDRQFVILDDPLPAGLEAVDVSLRTTRVVGPFAKAEQPRYRSEPGDNPASQGWMYGGWDAGWWSPWEHKEIRDDRVTYFTRMLWRGSYTATYLARATTTGAFVRPPAHAEEMYNPALEGRSDGGVFDVQ